jgi:hypothetical protein
MLAITETIASHEMRTNVTFANPIPLGRVGITELRKLHGRSDLETSHLTGAQAMSHRAIMGVRPTENGRADQSPRRGGTITAHQLSEMVVSREKDRLILRAAPTLGHRESQQFPLHQQPQLRPARRSLRLTQNGHE